MSSVSVMSSGSDKNRVVPVRVKKKTLKKLTNAEKLEIENSKMEERLRQLRQQIEKDKEVRSGTQRDFNWKSGRVGAVTTHAKQYLEKNRKDIKVGERKIKVKFLTADTHKGSPKAPMRSSTPHNNNVSGGESWATQQQPTKTVSDNLQQPNSNDSESWATQQQPTPYDTNTPDDSFIPAPIEREPSVVGPICGQCEADGASVNCVECGEKYCMGCFTMFHKKGALKNHTSRPLTRGNQPTLKPAAQPSIPSVPEKPTLDNSLWGDYDEGLAAESFAEALRAWRGEETVIPSSTAPANSAQTTTTQEIPEIVFAHNENLTYFDRMLLKRNKEKAESSCDSESRNEITVSQLDFCRDLLQANLNDDRASRMEIKEEEGDLSFCEVNPNIGYLEESSECVIEDVIEPGSIYEEDSESEEKQFQIAREILSGVRIEAYTPTITDSTREQETVVPAPPPDKETMNDAWPTAKPLHRSNTEIRISRDLSTRSPLIRRSVTVVQPNKIRPSGEDDILGTQSWKTMFLGFLKAGLPGYTLGTNDIQQQREDEGIMLRGPPIWCPSESVLPSPSEIDSVQEQDREISSTSIKSSPLKYSTTEPVVRESMKRDLDLSCLEDEHEKGLEDLGREMTSASITSGSRPDMADYLMTLRRATPDAVTLLTHNDRMTQLDLESRGLESTTTPIITPRLTTRESLFEDFEDVERQMIMAGDEEEKI